MPKTKKEETSDSDSGSDNKAPAKKAKTKETTSKNSDSDSGPDDRAPVKKAKTKETTSKAKNSDNQDNSWTIGKNRHVKLTEFKGKWYVDIREFYVDNSGETKPGRKGIMLNMEQWRKFKDCLDDVDEAIKQNV